MHQRYIAVENIVKKGEIACNKQFLVFSQGFLSYMTLIFYLKKMPFKMLSAICFNWDQSKILSFGYRLTVPVVFIDVLYTDILFLYGLKL